jgi:hypothetical protein
MPYALCMRKVGLALATALAIAPRLAAAQDPSAAGTQGGAFNLQREQLGSYAAVDAARARARRGDCAGALPLFDQAISTIDDATLRRDRGLCHDALHDPYPAIDDYRAYLFWRPDATDADDIRARLERLEAQVGVGGPSPYANANQSQGGGSASASVSVNGNNEKYDSVQAEEQDTSGPLRNGHGWVLAPAIGIRSWFFSGSSQSDVAENVSLRLAWVANETSSLLAELGYEMFDNSGAEAIALSGLTTQIAYEARIPFSRERNLDNLVILGAGVGYEHLIFSYGPEIVVASAPSIGAFGPRARAGYRHNVSRHAALEFTLDGGASGFFAYNGGPSLVSGWTPWMGLNVALLFGL